MPGAAMTVSLDPPVSAADCSFGSMDRFHSGERGQLLRGGELLPHVFQGVEQERAGDPQQLGDLWMRERIGNGTRGAHTGHHPMTSQYRQMLRQVRGLEPGLCEE